MDIEKSLAQQEAGLALEFQQLWFCRASKAHKKNSGLAPYANMYVLDLVFQ